MKSKYVLSAVMVVFLLTGLVVPSSNLVSASEEIILGSVDREINLGPADKKERDLSWLNEEKRKGNRTRYEKFREEHPRFMEVAPFVVVVIIGILYFLTLWIVRRILIKHLSEGYQRVSIVLGFFFAALLFIYQLFCLISGEEFFGETLSNAKEFFVFAILSVCIAALVSHLIIPGSFRLFFWTRTWIKEGFDKS